MKAGRRARPAPRQLATWFLEAARALDAVHEQGLVHRDVKPANLMLSSDGHLKLMDFGIAWTLDETRTRFTQTGMNMGTPAYMAPEQVQAKAARDAVGPAADVCGLAATFYELFTGRRLFDHDSDPVAATTSKQSLKFPSAPRVLVKGLPREMDTILIGGLQPEPAQRYGAADKPRLSTDLRHFLADEPIEYQPPPLWRRAALAYRRNRVVTNLLAGFLLAATAGVFVYVQAIRAEQRRTEAERNDKEKERKTAIAERDAKAEALRRARALGLTAISQAKQTSQPILALLLAREAARLDPAAFTSSNVLRESIAKSHERAVLRGHENTVNMAAFSPDGSMIVTASDDKTARVWDFEGKETAVLRGHEGGISSAAFSPDGSRIVTASNDKTARIWNVAGEELAVLRGHADRVGAAMFSPDGSKIVTTSCDKTARLWDLTGRELAVMNGHEERVVSAAAFSPDGSRIVTASFDKTGRVWDLTGKELAVLRGREEKTLTALFSPDGKKVVTASSDRTARLWNLAGKELAILSGHEDVVHAAAFSPDGATILTASFDKTARVWDLAGRELAVLRGHEEVIVTVSFSPDGTRIVTASFDKTARIWDLAGRDLGILAGHDGAVISAAFSADGTKIVTASIDRTARVWPVDTEDFLNLADSHISRDFTEEERKTYADLLGDR